MQTSSPGAPDVSERALRGAEAAWGQVVSHAPRVLTAAALLLGLWVLALVARAVVVRLLGLTKLDAAVAETRVGKMLTAFSKDLSASKAVAQLVYAAVVLLALTVAADTAGLDVVQEILGSVLGYVPTLLSALLIVAAGGYFASVVGRAVASVLTEMRSPYAKPLAGIAEGALLVIVLTIAIDTLGVDLSFITTNLTLLVGAFTFTFCVLFAWSMRRPAEEIIANYYLRRLVAIGDRVELGEFEGTVERFAAIGVVLRDADDALRFVPARYVLDGLRRTSSKGAPKADSSTAPERGDG